ncbi:mandelate racemase/muconate lactonizing enzyme family protein [Halovulum sp. GXIMD14794]
MTTIARAEILHFRHRVDPPIPTTMGPVTNRPALLIRLEDSEGAEGWGEVWCNFPPDGDLHRARLAANLLPAVLPELTSETKEPAALIRKRLHRVALQAGEPGPVSQIAAGVDIALLDLRARRQGMPLATLLGGTPRAVPGYASGLSPVLWEEQFARMTALGHVRFKLRIGFGPGDGLDQAEALHAALPKGKRMMVDANQAWDYETARKRLDRLGDLDPLWLEEPMPVDAPASDWARLAQAAPMRLAGGENMGTRAQFDAAVEGGALGVIQPDICKWGGLSGTLPVARAAEAAGLTYCPHFLGGGVGLIASAHLLAAVGGDGLLEIDGSENPLLEVLSGRGLGLDDGLFTLPEGPGLGYIPDTGAVSDLLVSRQEVLPWT